MLDHISIIVSDFARSKRFYEAVLHPLGYRLMTELPEAAGFGVSDGEGKSGDPGGDFWIARGKPVPPLVHVAFNAASSDAVDAFHAAALAAGGRDNGAPGLRPQYHARYYAAFVFDPDGYNIEAVCHAGASRSE